MIEDYLSENTYELQGVGSKSDPYQISSAMDLAYFSYYSRNVQRLASRHFLFVNDIYLNDGYFEEDGTYHDGEDGKLFEWTAMNINNISFLGNGHVVYGMYCNDQNKSVGLFSNSYTATLIENLTMANVYINCNNFYGVFGYNVTTISNCCLKSGYINVLGSAYVLVGNISQYVDNCKNYASVKGKYASMFNYVRKTITNCENYGYMETHNSSSYGIGAICHIFDGSNIENCVNYGIVKADSQTNYAAGIVGSVLANVHAVIKNCENKGKIFSRNYGGGIIGLIKSPIELLNCKNTGYVNGNLSAGIIGGIHCPSNNMYLQIIDCYSENCPQIIGMFYWRNTSYELNILIKNLIFDCSKAVCNNNSVLFGSVSGGKDRINIDVYSARIILENNTNLCLFRDEISASLRHVLIDVDNDYNKEWNNATTVDAVNVIIQKDKKPIAYYGKSFLAFFFSWKTGEIGLSTLQATGIYQGVVTEDYLQKRNAEKRG